MKRFLPLLLSMVVGSASAQTIKPGFYAKEGMKTYYRMGWDSIEEAGTWNYYSVNNKATWQLYEKTTWNGLQPFSYFDANSKYSLGIRYSEKQQKETAKSPEIEIKPNSVCNFYSCFSGGFLVFAKWMLKITDVATKEEKVLLNSFIWAQNEGYTGPNWIKFNIDLSAYSGKKVQFSFVYEGKGGEDTFIDGFEVSQIEDAEATSVSVTEGQSVHFANTSEGEITSYSWIFTGGTPSSSTEKEPVVIYNQSGVYPVTLTVSDGTNTQTFTRNAYIDVKKVAPKALIGLADIGYLSPFIGRFIPTGTSVAYKDLSEGKPTEWTWTFTGANIARSNEQNPIVTYNTSGVFSVGLKAKNDAGVSDDALINFLQVGGEQYIWNISPEENSSLNKIDMSWYGYYAGSNWLGITKFAEQFTTPSAQAQIKSVDIYFASNTTVTPDTLINVSIAEVGTDGMPGTVLATTSLKASQLIYVDNDMKPTTFAFATPITVNKAFFVVIDGIPNIDNGTTKDEIAIFCHRRKTNEKCTTFHLLTNEDEHHQPTGTYTWLKNTEDPLSMAVCPLLSYNLSPTAIDYLAKAQQVQELIFNGNDLLLSVPFETVSVFTIDGRKVLSASHPDRTVSLSTLPAGIYVVKANIGSCQSVLKVMKK